MPTESDWYHQAFRHAIVGMAIADLDGRWLEVNEALCRIVRYTEAELLKTGFRAITHPDDIEADAASQGPIARGEADSYEREKRYVRKDGTIVWVHLTVSLIRDAEDKPVFCLAQVVPVERFSQRTVRAILYGDEHDSVAAREVLTDVLTGIANRRGAEEVLRRAFASAEETEMPFCVAMIDLDHFKRINDTYGHGAGDEVLKGVARILSAQARSTDTVARWGGEEFIAIISAGLDGARRFCDRFRDAVAEGPMASVGQVTVSIGVAELEPGDAMKALVERADRCLDEAKRSGRNRVRSSLD